MSDAKCGAATPHGTLLEQIMDSTQPKNEREWAARREIESLRQRVEFESRKCSKCGTNLGLLHEDACPLCNCRQQLEEVRERERLLRDDVHNAVELNYSLSKRVKVLAKQLKSCLANKWKARCEKAEAELAALKAGQGSPNLPLGEPVAAWNGQYDQDGNAIEVNTSAPTIPEGWKIIFGQVFNAWLEDADPDECGVLIEKAKAMLAAAPKP